MGIMKTGLRRLHYFLVLTDCLNFRRAADQLGMTQPALSRAIAQLEDELGVALFERNNRHVLLTEAGEVFRDGCRQSLGSLEQAVSRTRKTANGEAGTLSIGYTDIAISGRLPGIVRSFRSTHPDVAVGLRQACTEVQYDLLRSGEIDVGFVTGPVDCPDFEGEAVQGDHFVAILPTQHRLAGQRSIAIADLADEPFVLGTEDKWFYYHKLLYGYCREAGFVPNVVQRAPDTQGIVGLIACGMGVTIQTENLKPYGDERVRMIPIRDCDQWVETQAVWNRTGSRQAVHRFIDHISRSIPLPFNPMREMADQAAPAPI